MTCPFAFFLVSSTLFVNAIHSIYWNLRHPALARLRPYKGEERKTEKTSERCSNPVRLCIEINCARMAGPWVLEKPTGGLRPTPGDCKWCSCSYRELKEIVLKRCFTSRGLVEANGGAVARPLEPPGGIPPIPECFSSPNPRKVHLKCLQWSVIGSIGLGSLQ